MQAIVPVIVIVLFAGSLSGVWLIPKLHGKKVQILLCRLALILCVFSMAASMYYLKVLFSAARFLSIFQNDAEQYPAVSAVMNSLGVSAEGIGQKWVWFILLAGIAVGILAGSIIVGIKYWKMLKIRKGTV